MELVETGVVGCTRGHRYQVRCHAVRRFSQDPTNCTALVEMKMPMCLHDQQVKCYQVEAYRQDPTKCKAKCQRPVGDCGHICQKTCGDCLKRTLERDPYFILSNENEHQLDHGICQSPCGKRLLCGHECKEKCHEGRGECGPCNERCTITCVHRWRGCDKKCSDPCIPCAESCGWSCEHLGECRLPCGAPCDRLPCDRRCNKILACGCRCPSLCGEKCPSPEYCLVHGSDRVKNMEVDVIMFKTYRDMTDDELTQDPLIVLRCGHAFLMSTLDGHMDINDFYKRDRFGRWAEMHFRDSVDVLKVDQTDRRRSIDAIRSEEDMYDLPSADRLHPSLRCIINKSAIDLMEQSFFQSFEQEIARLHDQLVDLNTKAVPVPQSGRQLKTLIQSINRVGSGFLKALEQCEDTPSNHLYQKTRSCLLGYCHDVGYSAEETAAELDAVIVPKPDNVRPCKALVGYLTVQKLLITVRTSRVSQLLASVPPQNVGRQIDQEQNEELRWVATGGLDHMHHCHVMIDKSFNAAMETGSNTRIVNVCKAALHIHIESMKFLLELGGYHMATVLQKELLQHEQDIDRQRNDRGTTSFKKPRP